VLASYDVEELILVRARTACKEHADEACFPTLHGLRCGLEEQSLLTAKSLMSLDGGNGERAREVRCDGVHVHVSSFLIAVD
jgi:hypothetical protein